MYIITLRCSGARICRAGGFGSTTDRLFYHYDGQNNVRSLADWSGTILNTYSYDAWGNVRAATGSTANAFGYDGQQQDGSGLYYLRARYYDPVSGRFAQQDPAKMGNWYTYANDNPVNATDPCGLCTYMHYMDYSMTAWILSPSDLRELVWWYTQAADSWDDLKSYLESGIIVGMAKWVFKRLAAEGLFGAYGGPAGWILTFLVGLGNW